MLLEILISLLLLLIGLETVLPLLNAGLKHAPSAEAGLLSNNYTCHISGQRNPYSELSCTNNSGNQSSAIIQDRGFSLFELCIGIMLSALILVCLGKSLAILIHNSRLLHSRIRQDQAIDRLQSEIIRLFRASDSHPFDIHPRIHTSGNISFSDTSPNQIMYGNSRLRPAADSHAFSNMKVEAKYLSDIKSCTANDLQRTGTACLRYSHSAALADYKSFLLVSLDGYFEAQGQMSGSGSCKNFSITLGRSILADSPEYSQSCLDRLIIPIEHVQTIYQAQSGEFRLITHRSDANVENQPISQSQPQIRMQVSFHSISDPWQLTLNIFRNEVLTGSSTAISHLGRQSIENYLLNTL